MAGDKIGVLNKIRRADIFFAEADVGSRHGTGFFGVVDEIALRQIVGIGADNLHRVFIGAYSTVGT